MNPLRPALIALSLLWLACIPAPSTAAPAQTTAPAVETNRLEIQRTCHHYRWSSRSHCTSAKRLRQLDRRPALHYPSRYFGGTPHYAQEFYWHTYPRYHHHRWHRWPYRYPYSWY